MSTDNLAVTKQKKVKKVSYTLDEEVAVQFNKLAENRSWNKSMTVNNLIKMLIENELSLIKN